MLPSDTCRHLPQLSRVRGCLVQRATCTACTSARSWRQSMQRWCCLSARKYISEKGWRTSPLDVFIPDVSPWFSECLGRPHPSPRRPVPAQKLRQASAELHSAPKWLQLWSRCRWVCFKHMQPATSECPFSFLCYLSTASAVKMQISDRLFCVSFFLCASCLFIVHLL